MTSSIEPTTLIEAMLIEAIRSNEPTKSIETAVGALAAARAPEIAQRTNATRALGSAHSNVNPQSNVTLPGSGDKAEDLGRKAARRGSILTEIARRFCDPKFDLTDAARGLGLSRRYIQRLLEGTGKSFTEHVLECRLQRARHADGQPLPTHGDHRHRPGIRLQRRFPFQPHVPPPFRRDAVERARRGPWSTQNLDMRRLMPLAATSLPIRLRAWNIRDFTMLAGTSRARSW